MPPLRQYTMKTYTLPLLIFFCGILLIGNSGCFRAIGENLSKGVTSQLDSTYLSNSSSAIVKAALAELLSDSTQQTLRRQLDSILLMTGDTLDQLSLRLRTNLIGEYTEEWIDARTDQLIGKLDSTLLLFKGRILDEQLEEYLQHLSQDILSVELQRLTNDLLDNLTGDRMDQRLGEFRPKLSRELDSLLINAIETLAASTDQQLIPFLDSLNTKGILVIREAEKASKSIVGYLALIGLLLVIIVAVVVFAWRRISAMRKEVQEEAQQKQQLQDMAEVITRNIDQLSSQKSYDELTRSIQREMLSRGLESDFREKVLEKVHLLKQEEWKDKDAQVLQLIKSVLKEESDNVPAADLRSLGPRQTEPEFTAKLRQRAREVGLEDHLDSLLN